jgi:serine/threonine protein kinase
MPAQVSSLKATLVHGVPDGARAGFSAAVTIAGLEPSEPSRVELGETLFADAETASEMQPAKSLAGRHTTVLPRRVAASGPARVEERARFERVGVLGEGAMGHVELARDNDIRRTVAVKRLHAEVQSQESLLRFADEVRIVGQLEHPAIVPVYDVGRDDAGRVFLVMKHISGETMEQIIEKLRGKDPVYAAQYSVEHRVRIFLGVLDAIRYAHARGVIHRDLKPANIMIGRYGEVTVLDWGLAKTIQKDAAPETEPRKHAPVATETHDRRTEQTQIGSLAGTPLYMSPEQAAGRNGDLDERSDIFSLAVIFLEWLSLEHPLSDKTTVTEVLAAIISDKEYVKAALTRAVMSGASAVWMHTVRKGMARDRAERFQSVAEFENELRDILEGRVAIGCHVSLARRTAHEALAWIDRNPRLYMLIFGTVVLTLVGALGFCGYSVVKSL